MKYLAILSFLIFHITAQANDPVRVIYGKVTCFNTFPIRGVEISSAKSKQAVRSDSAGAFAILVRDKNDALVLKAKGFQAVRYNVSKKDSVNLNMIFIDSKKNEEMVTAYGYITSKELTYAMTNLTAENNAFQNYLDIFDCITGTVPGVAVSRQTSPPSVTIRGATSMYASTEPLYILNGMPTSVDIVAAISPINVKSISVIKDSEAAIYGSRGANGVIIIELK